jgi:hypothetical protein
MGMFRSVDTKYTGSALGLDSWNVGKGIESQNLISCVVIYTPFHFSVLLVWTPQKKRRATFHPSSWVLKYLQYPIMDSYFLFSWH